MLEERADVPSGADPDTGAAAAARHFIGTFAGVACFALDMPDEAPAPEGHAFLGLRPLATRLPEGLFAAAGRAVQIVEWDRTHRFCGRCATPTVDAEGERAKLCPSCGLLAFPRLSPAVIVRVTRGDEILLAHGTRFPARIFSVLAGFVEPGESLEGAVVREIEEEVGIRVGRVRYFGSQPWPFPHSLMIGFTAEHESGELAPDPAEIVEAGLFTADAMPPLPPPYSIARRLIDTFVEEHRPG
jgi:NAD+ diphosphatase